MPGKQPRALSRSEVEVVGVPVAIKTLVIDGKRMTSTFFHQIVEQDLIDEDTGETQGMPIGFVNIHRKDCPDCSHTHVLWLNAAGDLRHALVVAPQNSERYNERAEKSTAMGQDLTDLLALLLAREQRSPNLINTGMSYMSAVLRPVSFGSLKLEVTSRDSESPYELLAKLEYARRCLAQEIEHSGHKAHNQDPAAIPTADLSSPEVKAARKIQQALADRHIVLAHPDLSKETATNILFALNVYGTGRELAHHSRYVHENWMVYRRSSQPNDRSNWLLFWRSSKHSTDQTTDEEAAEIEALVHPHLEALRLLLTDQAVCRLLGKIEQQAQKLLSKTRSLPSEAGSPLPPPAVVQKAIKQEQQAFRDYTARWQQSLRDLQEIDQLFIL